MNLSGNLLDYLVAFAGGVLVSFSPCVYPLLPASLSFIGANSLQNKVSGFILSIVYVSGLAVVYCLLGIFAALSGRLFGSLSIHPLTRFIVGLIFIFFGVALLGGFMLKTVILGPELKLKKRSIWQTFFFGISSGLIISPCTSAVLGSILVFVATKKNLFYAATLLLSFAYGLGFIFVLAGTFSSLLLKLPKSGIWMKRVNQFSGLILISSGIYFIYSTISSLR